MTTQTETVPTETRSCEPRLERKASLDVLKCLCAFLVVCLHTWEGNQIAYFFMPLERVAVPLFFMMSGFFYTGSRMRGSAGRNIVRILSLLLLSNLFYLFFMILQNLLQKQSLAAYFATLFQGESLRSALLFSASPIAGHLWYLSALLYVLLLLYVLYKKRIMKYLYALIPILLLGNLLAGNYAKVFTGTGYPIYYARNALLCGLPFFLIGLGLYHLYGKGERKLPSWLLLAAGTAFFAAASLHEKYLLTRAGKNSNEDLYASTIFLSVFLFLIFLKRPNLGQNTIVAKIGRELSLLIYILHVLVREAVSRIAEVLGIFDFYSKIAFLVVFLLTAILAALLHKLTILRKITG
ncbi:MAG: acyltransferase family protein [Lachnospiraceae bacterium]